MYKRQVLDGVDVLINVGDGDTAHTGGREWEDPAVAATVRGFVYNGGGLIGVGAVSYTHLIIWTRCLPYGLRAALQ